MEHYVGLDVSLKQTSICVVNQVGLVVRGGVVDSEPEAIAEIDWTGRISKCGDAMLRSYLFEAAGVLLTRVPKWSALKAWGVRLAKRKGSERPQSPSRASSRSFLHRMWIDRTEFDWSTKKTAA
jgi:hypothetical protein